MPPPEEYDELDADGEVDGLDSSATNSTAPSQATATAASLAAASGVGKRYRPAPAKTFQCRGYGECRMVFSRSEHLARHIRKHTGERPFTCHCGKQFSRLDNLRQHAQTVHAENPSRNEAMMRDLASVHATMTAGNGNLATTNAASPSAEETGASTTATVKRTASKKRPNTKAGGVKVKKESVEMLPSQRPGTSTGYEGAAASYPDTSGMDVDGEGEDDEDERREEVDVKPHVRSTQTQATIPRRAPHQPSPPSELGRARSFRSSQFRANSGGFRPSSASASSAAIAPGGSFRDPLPAQSSFGVGRDRESFRSHPYARRSPPELTPSPPITQNRVTSGRPFSAASTGFDGLPGSRPGTGGNGTRLPPITAFLPATGLRPGSSSSRPGSSSQSGGLSAGGILLPGSLTLRRPSTGHDWEWGDAWDVRPGTAPGKLLPSRAAPPDLDDASPFSFHVPDQPSAASAAANHGGSRKRPLGGPDGPYGPYPDDDGGKSRPASRRFSVMELCNDNQQRPPTRERERPTTTNGLISRASALVLDDRDAEHDAVFAWEAGEQHFAPADGPIAGTAPGSRPGSVRGRHAAAPGGPTAPDAWSRDERRLSGVASLASPGASILSRVYAGPATGVPGLPPPLSDAWSRDADGADADDGGSRFGISRLPPPYGLSASVRAASRDGSSPPAGVPAPPGRGTAFGGGLPGIALLTTRLPPQSTAAFTLPPLRSGDGSVSPRSPTWVQQQHHRVRSFDYQPPGHVQAVRRGSPGDEYEYDRRVESGMKV